MKHYERILHNERNVYSLPRNLRGAVRRRYYGRCAVSWCRQIQGLECHHILPREHGGKAELDNLMLLCTKHHDMAEESGKWSKREIIEWIGANDIPRTFYVNDETGDLMAYIKRDWHGWVYGGALPPPSTTEISNELKERRLAFKEKLARISIAGNDKVAASEALEALAHAGKAS